MEETIRTKLEQKIGHRFADPLLLSRALMHASLVDARVESNERMEFLGDSVLGLIVCERVFTQFPHMLEGEMTKIKSMVVSRQSCGAIAKDLGLPSFLKLGKGMKGGEQPASLAAAAFEAVIAAVFLDAGLDAARRFLAPLVDPLIQRAAGSSHQQNFKSFLQQHAQSIGSGLPSYPILDEKGPDHSKCFKVCVEIGGKRLAEAWGQSKKRAEQLAALAALVELGAMSREAADEAARQAGLVDLNGDWIGAKSA
ncbi:MAG: ribonuclease III [Phycisphaerales bacterium]|nr:ribonuclease III [Planctomycetota bacterium]